MGWLGEVILAIFKGLKEWLGMDKPEEHEVDDAEVPDPLRTPDDQLAAELGLHNHRPQDEDRVHRDPSGQSDPDS